MQQDVEAKEEALVKEQQNSEWQKVKIKDMEKRLEQIKPIQKKIFNHETPKSKQQEIWKFMPIKLRVEPEIPKDAQPYADAVEKEEMGQNHPQAVERLKEFLLLIPKHRKFRCCEVACGSGMLTSDFLDHHYTEVFMFDAKADAVEEARDNTLFSDKV